MRRRMTGGRRRRGHGRDDRVSRTVDRATHGEHRRAAPGIADHPARSRSRPTRSAAARPTGRPAASARWLRSPTRPHRGSPSPSPTGGPVEPGYGDVALTLDRARRDDGHGDHRRDRHSTPRAAFAEVRRRRRTRRASEVSSRQRAARRAVRLQRSEADRAPVGGPAAGRRVRRPHRPHLDQHRRITWSRCTCEAPDGRRGIRRREGRR